MAGCRKCASTTVAVAGFDGPAGGPLGQCLLNLVQTSFETRALHFGDLRHRQRQLQLMKDNVIVLARNLGVGIADDKAAFAIADFPSFLESTDMSRQANRNAEYGNPADPAMRAHYDRRYAIWRRLTEAVDPLWRELASPGPVAS